MVYLRVVLFYFFLFPFIMLPIREPQTTSLQYSYPAGNPYPPPVTPGIPDVTTRSYLPIVLKNNAQQYNPFPTNSFYLKNIDNLYNMGCEFGTILSMDSGIQHVFTFLDFGVPNRDGNGRLGTVTYNQKPVPIEDIKDAVIDFASGFYGCTAYDQVMISVGTNSSGGSYTDLIAFNHGAAWAQLVIDINTTIIATGMSSRVTAAAGNNIEPNYNSFDIPNHWLQGYDSVNNPKKTLVYIIGSADGCPTNYPPSTPGQYSAAICYEHPVYHWTWTQADVLYVNWGYYLSYPIPEIYDSVMADQWYRLSLYANFNNGFPIRFPGTLTQQGACFQDGTCPPGTNIGPITGFNLLYSRLQGDIYTVPDSSMIWATDIRYGN